MKSRVEIEKAFGTLGLDDTAKLHEVKEAHRFLVQTFHEDKYPDGSSMREKAKEKMIALNSAYEVLKEFFQEFPNGFVDYDVIEEERKSDWQNWHEDAKNDSAEELTRWKEEERARREALLEAEAKKRRQTTFNFSAMAAVAVFIILIAGHKETVSELQFADQKREIDARAKLYDHWTQGVATRGDLEDAKRATQQGNDDAERLNGGLIVLYAWLAGMIYVFALPRPRRYIAEWLETGIFREPVSGTSNNDKSAPTENVVDATEQVVNEQSKEHAFEQGDDDAEMHENKVA